MEFFVPNRNQSVPVVAPPMIWTTAGSKRPFSHWRDGVTQAFTALTPQQLDERPFGGRIRLQQVAHDVSISEICSTAQIVRRTPADVRNKPCDAVFVNLQTVGRSVITQRGIEARVPSGSVVLLDARQPFAMKFDDDFEQLCAHVPTRLLRNNGLDIGTVLGRVIAPNSPYAPSLFATARAIITNSGDADLLTSFLDLLSVGLTGAREKSLADQHLKLLQEFVLSHLGDPCLCPATVAAHFKISRRHLHKLFARSGQSYGQFQLEARLGHSDRLIHMETARTLSEIATLAGFSSFSHFSRTYRQRFGIAPSQRRRAVP